MLVISAFTFFGLSALQNLSYFTNVFGETKITINISAQEEENETTNSEVKEVKAQIKSNHKGLITSKCNAAHLLAFHHHNFKLNSGYLEVVTPPPELSIL
jgi:hypothetical protein